MVKRTLKNWTDNSSSICIDIIPSRLLCHRWTLLKSCSDPPRRENVQKSVKRVMHGKVFMFCLSLTALFTPFGKMLSLILFSIHRILCIYLYFSLRCHVCSRVGKKKYSRNCQGWSANSLFWSLLQVPDISSSKKEKKNKLTHEVWLS